MYHSSSRAFLCSLLSVKHWRILSTFDLASRIPNSIPSNSTSSISTVTDTTFAKVNVASEKEKDREKEICKWLSHITIATVYNAWNNKPYVGKFDFAII